MKAVRDRAGVIRLGKNIEFSKKLSRWKKKQQQYCFFAVLTKDTSAARPTISSKPISLICFCHTTTVFRSRVVNLGFVYRQCLPIVLHKLFPAILRSVLISYEWLIWLFMTLPPNISYVLVH